MPQGQKQSYFFPTPLAPPKPITPEEQAAYNAWKEKNAYKSPYDPAFEWIGGLISGGILGGQTQRGDPTPLKVVQLPHDQPTGTLTVNQPIKLTKPINNSQIYPKWAEGMSEADLLHQVPGYKGQGKFAEGEYQILKSDGTTSTMQSVGDNIDNKTLQDYIQIGGKINSYTNKSKMGQLNTPGKMLNQHDWEVAGPESDIIDSLYSQMVTGELSWDGYMQKKKAMYDNYVAEFGNKKVSMVPESESSFGTMFGKPIKIDLSTPINEINGIISSLESLKGAKNYKQYVFEHSGGENLWNDWIEGEKLGEIYKTYKESYIDYLHKYAKSTSTTTYNESMSFDELSANKPSGAVDASTFKKYTELGNEIYNKWADGAITWNEKETALKKAYIDYLNKMVDEFEP